MTLTQPFIVNKNAMVTMVTSISSSRADSASVPAVAFKWASALIGWRDLNGF